MQDKKIGYSANFFRDYKFRNFKVTIKVILSTVKSVFDNIAFTYTVLLTVKILIKKTYVLRVGLKSQLFKDITSFWNESSISNYDKK